MSSPLIEEARKTAKEAQEIVAVLLERIGWLHATVEAHSCEALIADGEEMIEESESSVLGALYRLAAVVPEKYR
jgi:hypothetical protein